MLEAVELPARIPHLDARLPDMDADDLPHLLPSRSTSESGYAASGVQKQLPPQGRSLRTEKACTTAHGKKGGAAG